MDWEVQRFFARSTHLNPAALGKIRLDLAEVVQTLHMSVRAATWGDTSQTKLCVYGGLPFSIKRGRTPDHVIPIQIWLSSQYPLDPPTVYVVPSGPNEKILSNCPFCDITGLCYLPLLAEWSPANSTVKAVVLQLVRLCCAHPPLWIDDTAPAAVGPPPASGGLSNAGTATGGGGGGENVDDDVLCVVCLSSEKDAVLVPCGHFCCCISCATNVSMCPVCRQTIQFRQRVFK